MNPHTYQAALDLFEDASNHAGDAAYVSNKIAAGLRVLATVIGDMAKELDTVRADVRAMKEQYGKVV